MMLLDVNSLEVIMIIGLKVEYNNGSDRLINFDNGINTSFFEGNIFLLQYCFFHSISPGQNKISFLFNKRFHMKYQHFFT